MKIVVLGAGVQGTLYGVRLARRGHDVTFVARGNRAAELRGRGAAIRDALTSRSDVAKLLVVDRLTPDTFADVCIVTVRREQMDDVLPDLVAAVGVARFLFLVNHANGSQTLHAALGRQRVILGFPGAAGGIENGVDRYVEVAEQATAIEAVAPDVAAIIRDAGFRVELVRDMDSWLRRHAVFVTAVAGALYEADADPARLASDARLVGTFIRAVREGWAALDRIGAAPPPLALRAIFLWVPLPLAITYWRRLLRSPRGELYFAVHTRHAPLEMAALATDVRFLIQNEPVKHLTLLYAAVDKAAAIAN
jgi:2-dehydropantoate 2-reductase